MTADTVEHWYAAFTGPSEELKADQSLRAANYATFLPMERVRRRKAVRGRPGQFVITWEDVPLYPRYVFLGARAGQGLYDANTARGVSTVLYAGDKPCVIPTRAMEAMMSLADANGVMDQRDLVLRRKRFKAGQTVRADSTTPWSGFNFSIESDDGDIVVALGEIFGRLTPIQFRADQLQAI
jgi:transcription antitermination factor NusG